MFETATTYRPGKGLQRTFLLLLASLFLTVPTLAQHGLFLSAQADFSSDDRVFADGETIHIRVEPGVELDLTAVTESEFELEPVLDGEDYEGTLEVQEDGSFTASVDVDALQGRSPAWLLAISIEDEFDHGYEAQTAIVLSGRTPGEGDDDGEEGDNEDDDGEDEDDDGEDDEEDGQDEDEGEDGEDDEEDGDDDDGEEDGRERRTLRGTIASIEPDSTITIGETSFTVTSETELRGERGAELTFGDLEVGIYARARLAADAEGNLVAERIKIDRRFEDEDVKVTGRIEAASVTEITVHGITFQIDDDTEIEARDDRDIGATDLVIGQVVKVEGEIDGAGILVADEIKVRGRLHNEGRYAGLVTAAEEGTIEVNGLAFGVTDETIVEGAASVDEIDVGDRVRLRYRLLGDGSRLALRIRVGSDSEDEAELTGVIEAISGDTLFVANVSVVVTADTRIRDDDGNAVTAADLEVGQTVEVEGTATSDGILATSIKIEESVVVSGSVSSQESAAIHVAGSRIEISDETLIVGRNNVKLPATTLETGTFVEVIAVTRTDDSSGKIDGGSQMMAERILVMESTQATRVEDGDKTVPDVFTLKQNYPNPFNPSTTITFEISRSDAQAVTLVVYDVLGRHVRTLVDGTLSTGHYSYVWNGRDDSGNHVASGLYLYRLRVDEHTAVRSMTFMK